MLEDLSSLPTNACLAENINVHFCCLANHDLYLPILTLTVEGDNIWQYKPPTIPTGCCGTCNVEGPIPSRGRDRDSKIGPRFGIEIMHGIRDAENNHRDYGMAPKFESGCRD